MQIDYNCLKDHISVLYKFM